MKKLTSKWTVFNKRVFPVIWFVFLAFFVLRSIFISGNQSGRDIMFIVMLIPMAAFGYFIMKKMVFDLVDEVYDEGSTLLFKNGERQVRKYGTYYFRKPFGIKCKGKRHR